VTGGGGGNFTDVDEAYRFYGMKNPLEDLSTGGGCKSAGLGSPGRIHRC